MSKIKNRLGQKFGRLTVIQFGGLNKHGKAMWVCKCSCKDETIKTIAACSLTSKYTKSCGCLHIERVSGFEDLAGKKMGPYDVIQYHGERNGHKQWKVKCSNNKIHIVTSQNLKNGTHKHKRCGCFGPKQDLIGQTFYRLTVTKYSCKKNYSIYWECVCICGKIVILPTSYLKGGSVKSCGCLKKDVVKRGSEHYNWNPNLTEKDRQDRYHQVGKEEYKNWREEIYKRDNYTCQICKDCSGNNLNAHHLYSYKSYPNLRLDPANGICVCDQCHKNFHKKYGNINNTKEQFTEFLSDHGKTL